MASSFVPQAMLGQLPQGDASVESNFERRKSVDDVNGPGRDLKNPRRASDHDAGSHKQKKSQTAKVLKFEFPGPKAKIPEVSEVSASKAAIPAIAQKSSKRSQATSLKLGSVNSPMPRSEEEGLTRNLAAWTEERRKSPP